MFPPRCLSCPATSAREDDRCGSRTILCPKLPYQWGSSGSFHISSYNPPPGLEPPIHVGIAFSLQRISAVPSLRVCVEARKAATTRAHWERRRQRERRR